RPVVWRSTSLCRARFETRTGNTYYNSLEAAEIEQLLLRMEADYRARGQTRQLAVISPYQGQLRELQQRLQPDATARWQALQLELCTVDGIQGRDRDIVLYSPVRSNPAGQLGFLRDRRRLNVALSRARELLLIVGDLEMLEQAAGGPEEGNPYGELGRYL